MNHSDPSAARDDTRLVVLGLGSNVNAKDQISRAIELIADEFQLLVKSTRYIGPADGGPNDPRAGSDETAPSECVEDPPESILDGGEIEDLRIYSNAAVLIRTGEPYRALRKKLRAIEKKLGRDREDARRVAIDVDVLLIQGEVVRNKEKVVVVPHADLTTKRHAAIPCAEVAPSLIHPETGEAVGDIAARLA